MAHNSDIRGSVSPVHIAAEVNIILCKEAEFSYRASALPNGSPYNGIDRAMEVAMRIRPSTAISSRRWTAGMPSDIL
jgi:hypothetical protein